MSTKICRRCHKEKDINSFYKCRNMKDGHFNTCKDCDIIKGQEYRRIKSLDIAYVIKNRERRKRYPQSKKRHPFPETQWAHIWKRYGHKIKVIPRYQMHHWNYGLRYSVFYIHPSLHSKFHTIVKLDTKEKIFYFADMPLDTKEKHRNMLNWVNIHYKYNYDIIEYELNLDHSI